MAEREWKPGDVAMALGTTRPFVVVRHRGDPDYWSAADGWWPVAVNQVALDYRPLIVIDPEDREQVERLHNLWLREPDAGFRCLQAALREYADPKPPKPPKPDEPTGLGAVVEDAEGVLWMRVDPHPGRGFSEVAAWRSRVPLAVPRENRWSKVDAVRVLSEGVQP